MSWQAGVLKLDSSLPTITTLSCCMSESKLCYARGQSASLSWNKTPICVSRPDLYYRQTGASLLMWGALSEERTGLSFARVTVSSNKSVVSMYNLHFTRY
jgi:hypothetical protein